jgi:hypothetical protein
MSSTGWERCWSAWSRSAPAEPAPAAPDIPRQVLQFVKSRFMHRATC